MATLSKVISVIFALLIFIVVAILSGCATSTSLSTYQAMCNGQVSSFTKSGEYHKVECK